ncbi:pyridoxamine 5'-phosphate oxidase family protein [Sediminicola luteus]|uniref:Pyridoxamine 5'-phosphate oxidase N-terminal domain-containing protein n=1 Tax=Sediminicola luteus TaxID=319238 RepID=A0A2A4G322_9FLAO|nr:pyridoxamine 5'-phosphate oxidase family protein [Sediminicola luteus]PCE63077.1 hypothetical protein B7P33_17550 [Sediminicola luteus]
MRNTLYLIFIVLVLNGCGNTDSPKTERTQFSELEKEAMATALQHIDAAYYCTLVTVDETGMPRARVVEPFVPEGLFTVWMATNPNSRKVDQIKAHPQVTLHYFDRNNLSYVSLMGTAELVNDPKIKATKWKKGWERFYPDEEDMLLIRFTTETLEMISPTKGYDGNAKNWAPFQLKLRE